MLNEIIEIAQGVIIPTPTIVGGAQGLTLAEIGGIIRIIASFFTSIGVLLGIIAIIWAGISYLRAGANPSEIERAKWWFRNGLIGTLIILGVGAIINTIANVVTREFFCSLVIFGRCVF